LARQTYLICAPQLLIVEGLPGRCPAGYAGAGGGQGSVWWHLAGPARPRWRSQRRGGCQPLRACGQGASWLAAGGGRPSPGTAAAGTQDPFLRAGQPLSTSRASAGLPVR